MANTVSEPNTLLEINEAHADNFLLVIPRLPSVKYLSSVFSDLTKSVGSVSTSGVPDTCNTTNNTQIQREHNLDLTNFKLYLSSATLPNITVANYEIGTQMATLKRAGKTLFSDFTTTMQISENFLNYNIILYWMYMIHNPQEYNKMSGRDMIDHVFTDIYLIITNNHQQKIAEYQFMDAFPTSLPPITFTVTNAEKINADVTWSHSGMKPTNNFVLKYV